MSRLDPDGNDFNPANKKIVGIGPSVGELREKMSSQTDEPGELGPIQSAAAYGSRVRARQAQTAALKKPRAPLGGAPPLDPEKMKTLAEGLMPRPDFGTDAPERDEPVESQARKPFEPPEEMSGVGSAYHVNREMAKGNVDRPVSLKGARRMVKEAQEKKGIGQTKQLSSESLEALQRVKEAAEEDMEINARGIDEDDEDDGSPHLGDDGTKEELDKATDAMLGGSAMFDFAGISEATRGLTSKKRRKEIEKGLKPLNIGDMVVKREIVQNVPIIPNQLIYTFRTFNQSEHLFCLQYVYENPGSAVYAEELLNTCKLVCALVAVNEAPLPDHRDHQGTDKEVVSKEKFEKKMHHVASLPTPLVADLSLNIMWFMDRVNNLFSADTIKNG